MADQHRPNFGQRSDSTFTADTEKRGTPAAEQPAISHSSTENAHSATFDNDEAADAHRSRGTSKSVPKPAVRRIASKVTELLEADESTLNIVAGLLGVKNDPVDLTVAIMTADRAASSPIKDIQATLEESAKDQISAVLGLNAVSRAQFKAMWTTMGALNGKNQNPPSNEKAAISALFGQIIMMTDAQKTLLDRASVLLRRS